MAEALNSLADWYNSSLGQFMPKEVFIFLVSMVPLIELRGGLVVAKLLGIGLWKANLICIIGNIIPIPFILLFIKAIFAFMKKHNILKGLVVKLEGGEFLFLLFFVGIPLPGTGAWTGSLIAALFDFDIKKASIAIFLGLLLAALLMSLFSYGFLGLFV